MARPVHLRGAHGSPRSPGGGQGHPVRAPGPPLRACPTSRPATCCGPRSRRAPSSAQRAKEVMDAGGLVPDEIMIGVVDERLHQTDTTRGATCSTGSRARCRQAEALDRIAGERPLHVVINLEVADRGGRSSASPAAGSASTAARSTRSTEPPKYAVALRQLRRRRRAARRRHRGGDPAPPRPVRAGDRAAHRVLREASLLVEVDGIGTTDEVSARLVAVDRRSGSPG